MVIFCDGACNSFFPTLTLPHPPSLNPKKRILDIITSRWRKRPEVFSKVSVYKNPKPTSRRLQSSRVWIFLIIHIFFSLPFPAHIHHPPASLILTFNRWARTMLATGWWLWLRMQAEKERKHWRLWGILNHVFLKFTPKTPVLVFPNLSYRQYPRSYTRRQNSNRSRSVAGPQQ